MTCVCVCIHIYSYVCIYITNKLKFTNLAILPKLFQKIEEGTLCPQIIYKASITLTPEQEKEITR